MQSLQFGRRKWWRFLTSPSTTIDSQISGEQQMVDVVVENFNSKPQAAAIHKTCSRIADVFHHVQDADRWADTRRQAEIISDTSDADRILSAASETVLVPPWLPLASAARLSMEHEYETCSITENNFWYSYFLPFPFLWTHSHTHSRHLWILIFIVIPSQFPMCFYCF